MQQWGHSDTIKSAICDKRSGDVRKHRQDQGLLFVTHEFGQILRNTAQGVQKEVEALEANRLLNTAPEDLKLYLVAKYAVTPITLLRDQWYADSREVQVDVRHDPMRWIDDRSRPAMIPGERIEVRVSFDGESELFMLEQTNRTSTLAQLC